MLESFDIIRNVGRYETVSNTPSFGKLTLVYSENGKGKTTLCAVLRSLATGDANTLLERRRLASSQPPTVVAKIDGNSIAFSPSGWNSEYSKPVLVFDETFVNDNVFSGLSVGAGQRKNLHELVLGAQGVGFQQTVVQLTNEIAELHNTLREKQSNLTKDIIGRLTPEEFCNLQNETGLEKAIVAAAKTVAVIESSSTVAAAKVFESVSIPNTEQTKIRELLGSSLEDVHQESVNAVTQHVKALGSGAEAWISQGSSFASDLKDNECPFCGESLDSSAMFKHYETYFSAAYEKHLREIRECKEIWEKSFGGDTLAGFVGRMGELKSRYEFWNDHIELPEL